MTANKDLDGRDHAHRGRFVDIGDMAMPLFSDPDGRATRRWREMFGLQCPTHLKRGGLTFTVRVRWQSSSDW